MQAREMRPGSTVPSVVLQPSLLLTPVQGLEGTDSNRRLVRPQKLRTKTVLEASEGIKMHQPCIAG